LAWQTSCLLEKAEAEIEEAGDAWVGNPVEQSAPLPPGRDDAPIKQPLELVRHRLWTHAEFGRDIRDTQLPGALERVQHAKPRIACQHLEETDELIGLGGVDQRSGAQSRLSSLGRWEDRQRSPYHSPRLHDFM